ncbi:MULTISPECIES: SACE_7040 family transcriptional regulator [unclassified Streptomyces]|uniref:SACE_7040 family transcriptional regulator n=1 Tax=unclassified Streptomyces TaxID=2593676 RepID=UPI000DABFE45|nr:MULTISPECIES: TetR/AcrR family transcriptional regulator [unclassified Streptomyces]PZT71855.1 TetR/AcrR family transcriptional regulator [Streptomyces sp. AC1-42T]PZT81815.1 TetR/AcrR family transcriptional regulator [Streptomyces sp. AC1-42W]
MSTHAARVAAPTRREQILREAARLFAERGFHGVGVDEIGAAVGISGPGLYRHFPGKDAMLAELLVGISERLLTGGKLRVSEDAASGDGSPEALLDALIEGHIDFALDDRPLITLHDRELDRLRDTDRKRVRRLQRQYVEVWVAVVRDLYPDLPEHEARATVHAVFGLLNSTPHLGSVRRPAATPRGASGPTPSPGALPGRAETAALLHRLARGAFAAAGEPA